METVTLQPYLKDNFYNKVKTPNLNLMNVQKKQDLYNGNFLIHKKTR